MESEAPILGPATEAAQGDDAEAVTVAFGPVTVLADLKARAAEPAPVALPDHLPLSAITLLPELFQPRGMAEWHIQELARAAKSGRALDPVTVVQVGASAILIDGHHRVEAYRRAKVSTPVPVCYFTGTLEEAVLEAGRANSRAKLSMSVQERMDYAWRLVRMGGYSKKQVVDAAVVSDGQVGSMRRVLKALGAEAFGCDSWWGARKQAEGKAGPLTDEEREDKLEAQAIDYANRLAKEFSTKLATNPALAAKALDIYFGRKLPSLMRFLDDYVGQYQTEDEECDY